jgi:spore coat polysaccharide biosynthesis predicted glycosyltransferase SpsG
MEALAVALREVGIDAELRPTQDTDAGDVVVVDSYELRAERPRFRARVLAAVDDLERDLAVDLLVDPNPGGVEQPAAARSLRGPAFALVARPPAEIEARSVGGDVERILVTTGGADAGGFGATTASMLATALPDAEVALVVGPWSAEQAPDGVTVVQAHDGLWSELARADLVVTAGGVTMLEACLLGRPTVAVAVAANQERAVRGADEAGAVVGLATGAGPAEVADAAVALAADAATRAALGREGPAWIDGRGPTRVAEALRELV